LAQRQAQIYARSVGSCPAYQALKQGNALASNVGWIADRLSERNILQPILGIWFAFRRPSRPLQAFHNFFSGCQPIDQLRLQSLRIRLATSMTGSGGPLPMLDVTILVSSIASSHKISYWHAAKSMLNIAPI